MSQRFSRQGFLAEAGQRHIETARIGICGLGGGGSHMAIQLAYAGGQDFALFDKDRGEIHNLNRTVTLTASDIENATLKVDAAKRRILEIDPIALVDAYPCRWQDRDSALKACDIVLGGVDSFWEREQLEAFCRRHLIPYIDIGMDIHAEPDGGFAMSGQVIISMPGGPCMRCIGFLTDEKLAREQANYGDAGGRPQLVWPNGVLASTAVGLAIEVLTGWTRTERRVAFLSYRGNTGMIGDDPRLPYAPSECPHYSPGEVGDPVFKRIMA